MRANGAAKAVVLATAGLASGSRRRRMLATASPQKLAASVTMSYEKRAPVKEDSDAFTKKVKGRNAPGKLDVGPILKTNKRELQAVEECPEGFVICVDGQEVYDNGTLTGKSCSQACEGNCCTSTNNNACTSFTGKVCKDGSCDGNQSCFNTSTDVIKGCKGGTACALASLVRIADGCEGSGSCNAAGYDGSAGSIIGSCKGVQACNGMGAIGGRVGDVSNSCNAGHGCYSLAFSGYTGDITNSCNNEFACANFKIPSKEYSDLNNCCNNANECEEISNNGDIPSECGDEPPGPDPNKLSALVTNAAALAFRQCDVTFISDDVKVDCTFDSPEGVDATAQILQGTCGGNNDFNVVSSSAVTTASTVTASLSFADSITSQEKNSGSFTKQFCARADVFANDDGAPVSIGVKKVNVEVTLSYSNTGIFAVTDINITPVEVVDTSATATRSAQISASLGPCGGSGKASYAVGERLEICISSADSNAEIENIKSVSVADPSTELVDENGVANTLTVIGLLPADEVTLGTLVIADYDNSGNGSIIISGTADINFVTRRMLTDIRILQQDSTSEKFDLEVPILSSDVPDVTGASDNGAWAKYFSTSAAMLAVGVVGVF